MSNIRHLFLCSATFLIVSCPELTSTERGRTRREKTTRQGGKKEKGGPETGLDGLGFDFERVSSVCGDIYDVCEGCWGALLAFFLSVLSAETKRARTTGQGPLRSNIQPQSRSTTLQLCNSVRLFDHLGLSMSFARLVSQRCNIEAKRDGTRRKSEEKRGRRERNKDIHMQKARSSQERKPQHSNGDGMNIELAKETRRQ